jgi:predicted cupin superfamily sugar epimerase
MGTNPGESRQLLVGTGVWKRSRILPEDRALVKTPQDKEKIGCLITEVVVPGFHWEGKSRWLPLFVSYLRP